MSLFDGWQLFGSTQASGSGVLGARRDVWLRYRFRTWVTVCRYSTNLSTALDYSWFYPIDCSRRTATMISTWRLHCLLLSWSSLVVTEAFASCCCLARSVSFANTQASPRATKTHSSVSWAGPTHTSCGLTRRFGISNLPTTICLTLGAILTVPVVLTIHGSISFRWNLRGFCILTCTCVPSPLVSFGMHSARLSWPFCVVKTMSATQPVFLLAWRILWSQLCLTLAPFCNLSYNLSKFKLALLSERKSIPRIPSASVERCLWGIYLS